MQIKMEIISGRRASVITDIGRFSLVDTLECGQCFRHVAVGDSEGIVEYVTVVGDEIFDIAERRPDELIVFGREGDDLQSVIDYFSLDTDYGKIAESIRSKTDNGFLIAAAEYSAGIRILAQDPWEALFSFIISQNNNIPRIKGIIRRLAAAYGEPLIKRSALGFCPRKRSEGKGNSEIVESECASCGICFSFPTPEEVLRNKERLAEARVGFRYGYLIDACERVKCGEVRLAELRERKNYSECVKELCKIRGVGEKVASCAALFSLGCLDAFPVDVWMRRAIDEHFGGSLTQSQLGEYAGVAQQYIFHYKRKLENKQ